MKVLWITKIASKNLTGGTKVSWNYREELKLYSELTVVSRINLEENISISRFDFLMNLLKLRKEKFDFVFFDDHYCSMALFFTNHQKNMFYHGNWPNLMFTSFLNLIKGLYLFPQYLLGMKLCQKVIFVNPFFEKKFRILTKESVTLFNPLDIIIREKNVKDINQNEILMVGNVDSRKYGNLVKLLNYKVFDGKKIVIYGKLIDEKLVEKLCSFSNVEFKGLVDRIPYEKYMIHFNCSKAENLPLSLFESLKNGLKCIYPKSKNYSFLFDNSSIFFYKDLKDLNGDTFKNVNYNFDNKLDFLSITYKQNLEKLFNKKI